MQGRRSAAATAKAGALFEAEECDVGGGCRNKLLFDSLVRRMMKGGRSRWAMAVESGLVGTAGSAHTALGALAEVTSVAVLGDTVGTDWIHAVTGACCWFDQES